jgi:hypothetical protein
MPYFTSGMVKWDFDENGHSDPFAVLDKIERNARSGYLKPARSCSARRCMNDNQNAGGFHGTSVPRTHPGVWASSIEVRFVVMRDSSIHGPRLAWSSIAGYRTLRCFRQDRKKANGIVAIRKRTASMSASPGAVRRQCATLQSLNGFVHEGGQIIDGGGGYYTLYPRGRGASEGAAPDGYVLISRWASSEEAESWLRNGGTAIQSGIGGDRVYVTMPDAVQPAGTGPIRIDFAVPQSALMQTSNAQWRIIMQPIQSTPIHNVTIVVPDGITFPK